MYWNSTVMLSIANKKELFSNHRKTKNRNGRNCLWEFVSSMQSLEKEEGSDLSAGMNIMNSMKVTSK